MVLRVLTRKKRHAANLYEALIVVKGRASFKDAYKRLITTIAPAAAAAATVGSSAREHSSSWHTTCWGAAAAVLLGATTTVGLAEAAESAATPTAEKVGLSFSFSRPPALDTLLLLLFPCLPYLSIPLSRVSI